MKSFLAILLLGTSVLSQATENPARITSQASSDHLPASTWMLGDSNDDPILTADESSHSKRNMRLLKPTVVPGANLHELGHAYHSVPNGAPTTSTEILVKTVFLAHNEGGNNYHAVDDKDAGDISDTQSVLVHTVTVIGQGNYSTFATFSSMSSKPSLSTLWPTGGYTSSNHTMHNMTRTSSETVTSTGQIEQPITPHNHKKGPDSSSSRQSAVFGAFLACVMAWAFFIL